VIVIAKKVGRLANRLLLFAHFIGAALEHGFTVVNPAFGEYARYFPSTSRDPLSRFPPGRRLPVLPGSREVLYRGSYAAAGTLYSLQERGRDVGLIRLRRDQTLDLNSDAFLDIVRRYRVVFVQDWFFRNAGNCERHRDEIRSHLTPFERHLEAARGLVAPARERGRFLVGVHVRRGDYETFKGGRFFYSHAQYRTIMEGVQAVFPSEDVTYLVCSDAPVPPGAFDGLDVLFGNGHAVEDLYALAQCDRLVGPPSTYAVWASFYGSVPLYELDDPEPPPGPSAFYRATLGSGSPGLSPWPGPSAR
jgi:hypothetical protein